MSAKAFAPPPIRKTTVVSASRERAFDLFTSRMTAWWFTGQGIAKQPFKEIVLEPKVGGRWFERAEDDSTMDWGEVIAWERPAKLLLAWRIDANWSFDPKLETVVEITFEELGPRSTRVSLEHRNLERMGEAARKMLEGLDGGWASLLNRFAELAAKEA